LKQSFFRIIVILLLSFVVLFLTACDRSIPINVNFDSRGGSAVAILAVQKGDTVPIPTVTKEGYFLEGWYTSLDGGITLDEKWSFVNSVVNNEITLYAKWTINQYTINFMVNETEVFASTTQDYNTIIAFPFPEIPVKVGFSFTGWYLDEAGTILFEGTTIPAENLNLYAGWEALEDGKDITLNINYYRVTNDYTDWIISMWSVLPYEYDAEDFTFTFEDEEWATLSINLSDTNMYWSNIIGFLLTKADLSEKDIEITRFIDLSQYESGSEINIYLVKNIEEIFFDANEVDDKLFLENTQKDYYATGNFNGWDTINAYKMVPIYLFDERVNSIRDQLTGVKYLYILEITLPDTSAGWDVTYKINGNVIMFDGNLTVIVIRTFADDSDSRDFWAQGPESGPITNLTPLTLYIPPFMEGNIDQAGGWNDNIVAYQAGTYYLVFAEYEDYRAMGLIPIT